MTLQDFYPYYYHPTSPKQSDYISSLIQEFFATVCKIEPSSDFVNNDLIQGMFLVKFPNLKVKEQISSSFEYLDINKDRQQIDVKISAIVEPILHYTFIREYEKYCHLAMAAGLVYNATGKKEDYKYSPIQNYNIQSERTVTDSFGKRKDTTTHGADTESYVNGKRSQSSSNSLESTQQTDNTNGERNVSNYDTSMENETAKLSSKQTVATTIDNSKFQDKTSGTNVVESGEFIDTVSKNYGDISTTTNEYSNTHHEEYSEIGDKSLRPTAEVLKTEIDVANYTRFLDTIYTDCILALCESTVW